MKDTFLGIPIYRFYYPGDRDAVHEEVSVPHTDTMVAIGFGIKLS